MSFKSILCTRVRIEFSIKNGDEKHSNLRGVVNFCLIDAAASLFKFKSGGFPFMKKFRYSLSG